VEDVPRTRWEEAREQHGGYQRHFGGLIDAGEDIDGEARLADALAPRRARILDAGAGMGRVAAALAARGHRVAAVEKDPVLAADCRRRYPDVPVVQSDILSISAAVFDSAGLPTSYDVITVVGNVMILLAEDTEREVLARLGSLLASDGRMLVGFHPRSGPANSREYPFDDFRADAEASGLAVQHRFGSYQLDPPSDDYVVAVLHRRT
jgi:SAM-dependent methyltransferase